MFLETLESRVRPLADAFAATDLTELRLDAGAFAIEFRRGTALRTSSAEAEAGSDGEATETVDTASYDVISADLVGIVRFTRPAVAEGATLENDREIAFVESLGIRNPIRSRGAGRIAIVYVQEGQAVDYGAPLFAIDRSAS